MMMHLPYNPLSKQTHTAFQLDNQIRLMHMEVLFVNLKEHLKLLRVLLFLKY